MRFRVGPLTAAAMSVAAFIACGGSANQTTGSSRIAKLEIVSGNTQSGIAGEELADAVVVRVNDSAGQPLGGQIINFRIVAGGGSVFAGSALSDANGAARERWALGPVAGPQRLEARAVDSETGAAIVFASFDATARPGPAVLASADAGDNQVAAPGTVLPVPLRVKIADRYGNGVAGVSVAFVVTTGSGSVSATSGATDSQGHASTVFTLGPELIVHNVEARAAGIPPAIFGEGPGGSGAGY